MKETDFQAVGPRPGGFPPNEGTDPPGETPDLVESLLVQAQRAQELLRDGGDVRLKALLADIDGAIQAAAPGFMESLEISKGGAPTSGLRPGQMAWRDVLLLRRTAANAVLLTDADQELVNLQGMKPEEANEETAPHFVARSA